MRNNNLHSSVYSLVLCLASFTNGLNAYALMDVWVDLSYPGVEQGSESAPFDTLGQAMNTVTSGGTIHLISSDSHATDVLDLPITLNAIGGPFRLGILSSSLGSGAPLEWLGVTEIMYHPEEYGAEYIEFQNTGLYSLDLSGVYFSAGIEYTFPSNSIVPPGDYIVLVSAEDAEHFSSLYSVEPDGLYTKSLSNSGETITLCSPNTIDFLTFTYSDSENWPEDADGDGASLVIVDPLGDPSSPENWGSSGEGNESPGEPSDSPPVLSVGDTEFSHDRGFYDQSFPLSLSSETSGAAIRYTLDGSTPTQTSGILYTSPFTINRTSVVRALAYKTNWVSSNVDTHTYFFIDDIITQSPSGSAPGPGWPNSKINTQWFSYGMDPDVVEDDDYEDLIDDALLAIPSISVVTDLAYLLDPSTGIYVNAQERGIDWERPVSVELVNPDESKGFQLNAGLRIRGGYSRVGKNRKHSFRLFFRDEYGEDKLRYPLFGDEGSDTFEKIDLRTSQNYSWAFKDAKGEFNTMVRDVFNRDTQGAMGHPYTRSRYYHLYLNGVYWGIYQTQERSDAQYADTYLSGEKDDYDVVKVDRDTLDIEATDGTLDAWLRLWDEAVAGFEGDEAYHRAQGLNVDGSPNTSFERLLDVDNIIDYMLIIYYSGNFDGPISKFFGNVEPNNFYSLFNRTTPNGFQSMIHDTEHSLLFGDPFEEGNELYRNRTGPFPAGSTPENANPQWFHQQLVEHPEYRMAFSDRTHRYFFNDGLLTPTQNDARLMVRANQIEMAIIAESARWGDTDSTTPRTKNDDWLPRINELRDEYFPQRTGIVLNQLKNKGWYPDTDAPVFKINGLTQHGGFANAPHVLSMTNPNGSGIIYYTLDDSDPRERSTTILKNKENESIVSSNFMLSGDSEDPEYVYTPPAVAASALTYSGGITLTENSHVKARVLDDGEWSALNEATYNIQDYTTDLRITELMYHPINPLAEFIELTNEGLTPINLVNATFTHGIHFTFPSVVLAPDTQFLLVKDVAVFNSLYDASLTKANEYSGSLDNSGERIRLEDSSGATVLDFNYKDSWFDITDGGGYSLVSMSTNSNLWNDKLGWRASTLTGGTPGAVDLTLPLTGAIIINEVLAHSHDEAPDWIELYNTTGSAIDISGWYLSDNDEYLEKYQIAEGTTIPAGGYVVFSQDLHFGDDDNLGVNEAFALSENGETVYLSSGTNGHLSGYREEQAFGASSTGISFGRHIKSTGEHDFISMSTPTQEASNATPWLSSVMISEIMYHPATIDLEFVEVVNTSDEPIELYDDDGNPWFFSDGIGYTFPLGTTIPADSIIIIAKNMTAFSAHYTPPEGVQLFGPYIGQLDNAGEALTLSMPGDEDDDELHYIEIDRVVFDDDTPWPTEADGGGSSLVRTSNSAYGNDPVHWASASPTPGE